jgi:8-hydroxy-5-deazaflavin:NADPH oxidoreductase
MDKDNTKLVAAHTSSGAEELAKKIPQARVVQAFNSVPSEVLFAVFAARKRAKRPSLIFCGEDAKAMRLASELIRDA